MDTTHNLDPIMTNRPTPETDAARWFEKNMRDREYVEADFARNLERQRDELAEALQEIKRHGATSEQPTAIAMYCIASAALATKEGGV